MTQQLTPVSVPIPPNKYVRHMSLMVLLDLITRKLITDFVISEPGRDHRRFVYYVRDGIKYHGYVPDTPQNTHMVSQIDYLWESEALSVPAAS